MNASEARRQRREEERAARRRDERLAEKAERELEAQREAERGEQLRREAAREEAEVRAAELRESERRAELRARLRRHRITARRHAQARDERRRLARNERVEQERTAAARGRHVAERHAEAEQAARSEQRLEQAHEERRKRQAQEQQAAERQAQAEQAAGEKRRREQSAEEERAARSGETRRAQEAERRSREAEAERREQQLVEQRRIEALRRLDEERRQEAREAEARAERVLKAREARLRELAALRGAAEAERRRAEERRAREARRREAERRAEAEREARSRERAGAREVERAPEELPWLRTEDGRVVTWGGEPRVLRGVNVVGLDAAAAGETPLREALALDDRNLEELSERWGAGLVRLPFHAETVLQAPVSFRDGLDELVGALASSGLYTLLALEPAAGLPDQDTHDAWSLLAARYQEQPGVLFEPYAASAPLGDGWPDAALELVRTIRRIHQSSLLLLPGTGAGVDLEGLPLLSETGEPVHNLVYTLRDTSSTRPQLDERFAAFAGLYAVFVSEWFNERPDLGRSAIANAAFFERLQIGWCAGNWNAPPRLVADARLHRVDETRFGLIVRRALAGPVRPALTPFPV